MREITALLIIVIASLNSQIASAGESSLTIYNQDFAVVREMVPLQLGKGVNDVSFTGITTQMEPDSVILRDPEGKFALHVLEQNYRADPVSQDLLLSLYEGQSINFEVRQGDSTKIVNGKIVRSGYAPHQTGLRRYGTAYAQRQYATASGQPVIEVDGELRFSLPGIPLFPALKDDTILKPTIHWLLDSTGAGNLDTELAYITGGMGWEAAYNVISPEKSDQLELVGWVTIDNQSGKTFEDAKIKLMAGDVSKLAEVSGGAQRAVLMSEIAAYDSKPAVTEKAFDEFHLYSLERRTTLHDRETKQVEFIKAAGIKSERLYIYDGAMIDRQRYRNWTSENIRQDRDYGTQSNKKIWVMREFENSRANQLGIPLPRGRVRFYRSDTDDQMEFTGENLIDHTPKDETVRLYTGDAFDLAGERRRTHYEINTRESWLDESFEIKLRNHKEEAVEVRVVEHLYRWINWNLPVHSDPFTKTDSQTIEYRVELKPDEEKIMNYTVHYSW